MGRWRATALRASALAGSAASALALSACAALPWPSGLARAPGAVERDGWLDLRGIVHVHTQVSHDSPGHTRDVVAAARDAGVVWVALSEHTRNSRGEPAAGVVDGVILIPGWEVSVVGGGSLLALGVAHEPRTREPRALVDEIHAAGGAAFVGHLERSALAPPDAFAHARPDGVEILNLHAQALAKPVRAMLASLFLPGSLALRGLLDTPHDHLARWDALPEAHAVVGAVDAHARFRLLGPLGGTFDRYRDLFRMVTTHVLVREPSAEAIVEALRLGRSYVALEGVAPVDHVGLRVVAGQFEVELPRPARADLHCDGQRAARSEAPATAHRLPLPDDARWCHVRAFLDDALWIVTSARESRPGGARPKTP